MAVHRSSLLRRAGMPAVGIVVAATLCVSCSSSAKTTSGGSSTSTGTGTTTSAPAGGSTSTTAGAGGALTPFCTNFKASALEGLTNQATLKDAAAAWNQYAAQAPSDIKAQAQEIAKYVNDVANGNYTEVAQMAQKIPQDGAAIAAYYAAHCHA